jgi:3'-phosphoadenosine 5'-phosphosulfate sulfotransferase (PAPS reductase)/FAD synthetase
MSGFPRCSPKGSKVPKVLSYGGGLDSFAMLLLSIERDNKPDWAVFMDTGDSGPTWGGGKGSGGPDPEGGKCQGEWPGTYRHIREIVMPLCRKHGIKFAWLTHKDYPIRQGGVDESKCLIDWFEKTQARTGGKAGFPVKSDTRLCTTVAKVERFERWLNDQYPDQTVEVWIGFEAGEEGRAKRDPNAGKEKKHKSGRAIRKNCFPLMEAKLCRCRAQDYIQSQGFEVPYSPKSACVICPFNPRGAWRKAQKEHPKEFRRMEQIEKDKPLTGAGMWLSIAGYETLRSKTEPERDEETGEPVFKLNKNTQKLEPVMKVIGSVHMPLGEHVKDVGRAIVTPAGKSRELKLGYKFVIAQEPKLGKRCPICGRYHSIDCPKSVGCVDPKTAPRGRIIPAKRLVRSAPIGDPLLAALQAAVRKSRR